MKMAMLLTEAPANNSQSKRTCGDVGSAVGSNYYANVTESVIKTKTICQVYQELSVEVKKIVPFFLSLTITASGESSLQRYVDETCAVPASSIPIYQDNAQRLKGALAVILLSPVGPTISAILSAKGISHETNPQRLQEQLRSWTTNPGDSIKRGDVGKTICGILGC